MEILDHYGIDLKGKNAVVIGRSLVIGKPVAMMLMAKNATITICHTKTVNAPEIVKRADIVVSAAGVLGSLTKDYVRPGQVVIDVSMNWDAEQSRPRRAVGRYCRAMLYSARLSRSSMRLRRFRAASAALRTSVLIAHVVEAAERTLTR